MEYNRIVAVTGMPGLYEVVSSKADGAIVRSLEDKSTKFVSSRVHNLSHLESIEVYTVRDNVNLSDVFAAMKGNKEALPDVKDNKALKSYFEAVYPDLDFERVYTSDMKKMIKWFEVIQSNDIDFTQKTVEEASDEAVVVEETTEETATKKPAAKKAAKPKAKKEAAPESEVTAADETEKPKRGRKKKTEE
ncbi:MAG TPA: DUF5606 domain-containing protein [Flavisolibacter sp.]|jgi:hypothetical protein|nr:DUF5606 domain-containing protein [Flavisolibacter sp.]